MPSDEHDTSETRKDPDAWTTGDEPMTRAPASHLRTLSQEAGEPFEDGLTKAEASKRIKELQARTGRGTARGRPETAASGDRLNTTEEAGSEPARGHESEHE
jgi:hypothetical protein